MRAALWVKRRKFLSKQWKQIEHCMTFCEGRWEETNSQGSVDIHLFYGADASSLNQPALRPCWFLGSLEPNSIQHEEAVGADLTCHSFAFLSFSLPEQTLYYWGLVLFCFTLFGPFWGHWRPQGFQVDWVNSPTKRLLSFFFFFCLDFSDERFLLFETRVLLICPGWTCLALEIRCLCVSLPSWKS